MGYVRTKPSEFLVVAAKGKLVSYGAAANVFLWPGTNFVKVPGIQQEARFEMTQETQDGIPLRFKGIVIFRIVRPEVAAQLFDFSGEMGMKSMLDLISQACLGELRDKVSHMTMKQCIEERKTTLTDTIATALETIVNDPEKGWGVELEVVQVAQVFIVDNELRRQLEAETRHQIKSSSDLAEMQAREAVELAKIASQRRIQQQALETERQQAAIAKEKFLLQTEVEKSAHQKEQETAKNKLALDVERFLLQKKAEQEQSEADKPVALYRLACQLEVLQAEKAVLELEKEVQALRVEKELMLEKARQDLRKEILPLEQTPEIVEAASRVFQGANLSVYGEGADLVASVGPLLDLLTKSVRDRLQPVVSVGDGKGK